MPLVPSLHDDPRSLTKQILSNSFELFDFAAGFESHLLKELDMPRREEKEMPTVTGRTITVERMFVLSTIICLTVAPALAQNRQAGEIAGWRDAQPSRTSEVSEV